MIGQLYDWQPQLHGNPRDHSDIPEYVRESVLDGISCECMHAALQERHSVLLLFLVNSEIGEVCRCLLLNLC